MKLYRVFSYDHRAAPRDPGGALFIPPQGLGRIDNPDFYKVTHLADNAAGACAEVFNRGVYRSRWSAKMLRPPPFAPMTVRAVAAFEMAEDTPICDLDDPAELSRQALRPSRVVTRDYTISQAWALRIFQHRVWQGVKWWSYHDARWASLGIWGQRLLGRYDAAVLKIDHPALIEAAAVLSIPII